MKKLVVGSLVMLLMLTMVGFSFARQNEKSYWDITWDDLSTEGPEAFFYVQPKIAVAASSLLANDVANVILDNSGNYTFFKKQGSSSGDVEDRTGVTMYIKGFGAMDKFEMKDYTKFENTNYGGIIGFDWDRQYSDNFDATYGLFVAYAENELKEEDYEIELKTKFVNLTESGVAKAERYYAVSNLSDIDNLETVHYINNALKANLIMFKDENYIVKDGDVCYYRFNV